MEDFVATGNHRPQELAAISHKGFTLIELVIVLAVLGALASIAVPQLTGLQEEAKLNGAATIIASGINDQFAQDFLDGGITNTDWDGDCGGYNENVFSGNDNFDGLDAANQYQISDQKGNDKSIEINVPKYDKGTGEISSESCFVRFSSDE